METVGRVLHLHGRRSGLLVGLRDLSLLHVGDRLIEVLRLLGVIEVVVILALNGVRVVVRQRGSEVVQLRV